LERKNNTRRRKGMDKRGGKEEEHQIIEHPFEPIINSTSRKLILGTFPSLKSMENYYYGHPQNQFWKILAKIYNAPLPKTREEKKNFILSHNLALYDVIFKCRRKNSSDANLKVVEVTPIEQLLQKYPTIEKIFFTSRTGEKIFHKHFPHLQIPTDYLPSPSPAYAKLNLNQKAEIWAKKLLD
jgi:hypoxanthine-DNA glycosylase